MRGQWVENKVLLVKSVHLTAILAMLPGGYFQSYKTRLLCAWMSRDPYARNGLTKWLLEWLKRKRHKKITGKTCTCMFPHNWHNKCPKSVQVQVCGVLARWLAFKFLQISHTLREEPKLFENNISCFYRFRVTWSYSSMRSECQYSRSTAAIKNRSINCTFFISIWSNIFSCLQAGFCCIVWHRCNLYYTAKSIKFFFFSKTKPMNIVLAPLCCYNNLYSSSNVWNGDLGNSATRALV